MGDNKVNNGRETNPYLALKEGDVFVQSWEGVVNPLKFKVLNVNRQENKITVDCISQTGYSRIETWDDLDITELAFDTGEYRLITEEENAEQRLREMRKFAALPNIRDRIKL